VLAGYLIRSLRGATTTLKRQPDQSAQKPCVQGFCPRLRPQLLSVDEVTSQHSAVPPVRSPRGAAGGEKGACAVCPLPPRDSHAQGDARISDTASTARSVGFTSLGEKRATMLSSGRFIVPVFAALAEIDPLPDRHLVCGIQTSSAFSHHALVPFPFRR